MKSISSRLEDPLQSLNISYSPVEDLLLNPNFSSSLVEDLTHCINCDGVLRSQNYIRQEYLGHHLMQTLEISLCTLSWEIREILVTNTLLGTVAEGSYQNTRLMT